MVGKLMKHELYALSRVLVWFMGGVLLLGAILRICLEAVQTSGSESAVAIGLVLSTTLLVLLFFAAVSAMNFAAALLSVVRYFKSLFTGEGYLTFSLPVTPSKLLIAKFLSALIMSVLCTLSALLSVLIALPSRVYLAFFENFPEILGGLLELISAHPLSAVEIVLFLLVLIPCPLLYLYLIASIGQLFTKARVAITIGLYYGASFLLSMVFTTFLFPILLILRIPVHVLAFLAIGLVAAFDVASFW